jgi:hypothetical protein
MTGLWGVTFLPSVENIARLAIHAAINLIFVSGIVRLHFRLYRQRDYAFSYFLLNVVTFSLGFMMTSVRLELGLGLGLFGVFSILRYRTEAIRVRDLTYLLAFIGIGLLNSLAYGEISLVELLLMNGLIAGTIAALEGSAFAGREQVRRVVFDRLDLLAPELAQELLENLRSRTRLPVDRYEIGDVDLLRDTVEISVFYTRSNHASARQ